MIKLLIGGSPCTHWSIARTAGRETEPSGIGWELFKNYLIAKEKFKPDFFLYENNQSAARPIREKIAEELGVRLQYINSALVSYAVVNGRKCGRTTDYMKDGKGYPLNYCPSCGKRVKNE